MARFKVDGIDTFIGTFEEILQISDEAKIKAVEAGADIMVKTIQQKGESYGVRDTGMTLDSIVRKNGRMTDDGAECVVTVKGTRSNGSGARGGKTLTKTNADVAFMNNYGTRKNKAKPFFDEGASESENSAVEAATKTYENYLKEI